MIILSTKLKNAIKKKMPDAPLEFSLRNISINGDKRGCSGFVSNPTNGLIVYINTEEPCLSSLHFMYRYADSTKDFRGYHNRWASTLDELVSCVCDLLTSTARKDQDYRV